MSLLTEPENNSFFDAAMLRWISEHGSQGILVTDTDLKIWYCNRWIEKHTGKRVTDLVGSELLAAFPEIEERGLDRFYWDAVAGESRILSHRLHGYLLSTTSGAGSELVQPQQSSRISALTDGDAIIGTITIIEDVSDRADRERELNVQLEERERLLESELAARRLAEENSRVKDEFLATVSHEIRSPLNAIKGWTQILLRGNLDEETSRHALETIQRNVSSQTQIIEDLLDISRIVTGQLNLSLLPVNLSESIETAVDSVFPAAQAKELELSRSIEAPSTFVLGDADRLQQILWNLLSNAIKFTPPKGRIEVTLKKVEGSAELAIRDTGTGISPDFLPHVFERFRQADGTLKRRYGGLGLGLSIVKNLVEMHGGTIVAESDGDARGTCFTITFPVIQSGSQAAGNAGKGDKSMNSSDLLDCRILIVDDEEDSREILGRILESHNADVRSMGSVEDAMAEFTRSNPDILISDLGMPEVDGYDLIKQIRQLPPEKGGKLPAIALSGYVSLEEQKRVQEAGFDKHIPKPLDQDQLINTIRELLKLNQQ